MDTGEPDALRKRTLKRFLKARLLDPCKRHPNGFLHRLKVRWKFIPRRIEAMMSQHVDVWSDNGMVYAESHRKLGSALEGYLARQGCDAVVRTGMVYGKPTLKASLKQLRKAKCAKIVVLPLYPQPSYQTLRPAMEHAQKAVRRACAKLPAVYVEGYSDHPAYISTMARSIEHAGFDAYGNDKLLFAFRSAPLYDIEAGDDYELAAGASALAIASTLDAERKAWTIGYRDRFSELGEQLSPPAWSALARWAESGSERVFVVCPDCAVDGVDTIQEARYDLKPRFLGRRMECGNAADGNTFVYVPCLGATKAHVKMLAEILDPYL